jgi:hypothetical protein
VIIRREDSWLSTVLAGISLISALLVLQSQHDEFMAKFYIGSALVLMLAEATTFISLGGGMLTRRVFLIPLKQIPLAKIESVQPHRRNGKWGYGTVFEVHSSDGTTISMQPADPQSVLTLLRAESPQAAFSI